MGGFKKVMNVRNRWSQVLDCWLPMYVSGKFTMKEIGDFLACTIRLLVGLWRIKNRRPDLSCMGATKEALVDRLRFVVVSTKRCFVKSILKAFNHLTTARVWGSRQRITSNIRTILDGGRFLEVQGRKKASNSAESSLLRIIVRIGRVGSS